MRYHSCDLSIWDGSFSWRSRCCQSVVLPHTSTSTCEVCLTLRPLTPPASSARCFFPAQTAEVFQALLRQCCLTQLPSLASSRTETSATCSSFLNRYSPFSHFSACCRRIEPHFNQSQTKEETDFQEVQHTGPLSVPPQDKDGITGLKCHTNRTLRFYLLDEALNWPLAMRLGASDSTNVSLHQDTSTRADRSCDASFAAIVNLKDETHHILHRSPAATLTESLGKKDTRWLDSGGDTVSSVKLKLSRFFSVNQVTKLLWEKSGWASFLPCSIRRSLLFCWNPNTKKSLYTELYSKVTFVFLLMP